MNKRSFLKMLTGIIAASTAEVFSEPPVGLLPTYAEEHKDILDTIDFQALLLDLMSARMADDLDCSILGVPPLSHERWMEVRGEEIMESHINGTRKGITVNTLEAVATLAPLPYSVLADSIAEGTHTPLV